MHLLHIGTGQNECLRVDRIGRIRNDRDIARVGDRLYKVDIPFFATHGRYDLLIGIEINIVFSLVPVTHGQTKFIYPFACTVPVCLGTLCHFTKLVDDRLRCIGIGISHGKINDIMPFTPQIHLQVVYFSKKVLG